MQLQAAGAGLPTAIPGLPPGLMGGAAAGNAAAAAFNLACPVCARPTEHNWSGGGVGA